jgi:hypothetical protein
MDNTGVMAKIGAVSYVLWGLLHYTAAYNVYNLAQSLPPTMAHGRLLQLASYLTAFATTAIVLAITLNWRNDRIGFWLNAVIIGVADLPFIVFILVPGYMPWWPGILGPVLWIVALACTAIASFRPAQSRKGSVGPNLAR